MDDGVGEYQGVETWWTRVRELMVLDKEEEAATACSDCQWS
jgi:hypothetical protein